MKKSGAPQITVAGGSPGAARFFAEANIHARRLGLLPPNVLTPSAFARHAKQCAKENKLRADVWDLPQVAREKSGGVFGGDPRRAGERVFNSPALRPQGGQAAGLRWWARASATTPAG